VKRATPGRGMLRPDELVSIGYEGRTADEFVAALQARRVDRLLDVRELPASRKKGFGKTALRERLEAAGIEYVHVREAGNPHRKSAPGKALALYRSHLDANPGVVDTLLGLASGRRVALMCFEREHERCHRSILLEAMTRMTRARGRSVTVAREE